MIYIDHLEVFDEKFNLIQQFGFRVLWFDLDLIEKRVQDVVVIGLYGEAPHVDVSFVFVVLHTRFSTRKEPIEQCRVQSRFYPSLSLVYKSFGANITRIKRQNLWGFDFKSGRWVWDTKIFNCDAYFFERDDLLWSLGFALFQQLSFGV